MVDLHKRLFGGAVGFAFYVAFGKRFLFIVRELALAERHLHFHQRIFEVHFQRHQRVPLTVDFSRDFRKLAFVEQQSAVAPRVFLWKTRRIYRTGRRACFLPPPCCR